MGSRTGEKGTETQEAKPCKHTGRDCGDAATTQRIPGAGRGRKGALTAPRGVRPHDFGLASSTVSEYSLGVSRLFVVIHSGSPRILIR